MNPTIAKLAFLALVGRSRFWLLLAFPILMVALTVLITSMSDLDDPAWALVGEFGYTLVLPIVAIEKRWLGDYARPSAHLLDALAARLEA